MVMNLSLLISNLFWPDVSQAEIYRDLSIPSLEKLLAKSIAIQYQPHEMEIWLCKTFNISQQQNN